MATTPVPNLVRRQVDQWAGTWLEAKFSRLLELRAAEGSRALPDGTIREWLATEFDELMPAFSPNGCWLAYSSDSSGRAAVYVRPLSGGAAAPVVSTAGGAAPAWASDGSELYFQNGSTMMAVPVPLGGWVHRRHACDAVRPALC